MKTRKATHTKRQILATLTAGFVIGSASTLAAQPITNHQGQNHQEHQGQQGQNRQEQQEHQGHDTDMVETPETGTPETHTRTLPPVPDNLPRWMDNLDRNHIYRKRGSYNDDIYNVRSLALDLNAVAVGHAMAYQDLVIGKANRLETDTFNRINWVLNNPPRFMPDEANISSTFGRKYGVLEQVFDWTHVLHAQTVDVLASTKLTDAQKDAEIERLYRFYFDSVPYAITPLPMNMGYLDSQPYSKAFRQKYPKVNGLFWGYHWLQGTMYDLLSGKTLQAQRNAYSIAGKRYHEVELYRTDRPFMPMFAEVSPDFAARFPHISNTFDNLHMLHDMVNDILASDWMTEDQKKAQIKRAIWMVSAEAHKDMKPGDFNANDPLHDHRFLPGMPGMGMMPEGVMNHGGMNHGGMNHTTPTSKPQGTTEQDNTNHDTMNHNTPQQGETEPLNRVPAGGHTGH